MFQSTPLREGRLQFKKNAHAHSVFQSTPLREGRRFALMKLQEHLLFQSTPLREGRHNTVLTTGTGSEVSIHAPA